MIWLVLAYPVLSHLAAWLGYPWLQWLALMSLVVLGLATALARRRTWAWVVLLGAGVGLFAVIYVGAGLLALYLPPILLPAALCGVFASSLRPGGTPFISRYARALRGDLPADLAHYTRRVTVVWVIALAMLAVSAVLCAWLASPVVWSLMTNVVHYVFLGALFLFEYGYRRYRFGSMEHPGFVAYIRALLSVRWHQL
jgi:uncharacterized membrane protein